jgi:hypothetical protein
MLVKIRSVIDKMIVANDKDIETEYKKLEDNEKKFIKAYLREQSNNTPSAYYEVSHWLLSKIETIG